MSSQPVLLLHVCSLYCFVPAIDPLCSPLCSVISLEDNDVLHMVKGDYAIFNVAQPDREQAVERVHQVCACTLFHKSFIEHDRVHR